MVNPRIEDHPHNTGKSSGSLRNRQGGSFSERLPGHDPPDENSSNDDESGERRNFTAKYGELTKKYSSKKFRDNPLLSNKGRSRGSIDIQIKERAGTMELICGAVQKRVNEKVLISVQSNNGLIVANNNP